MRVSVLETLAYMERYHKKSLALIEEEMNRRIPHTYEESTKSYRVDAATRAEVMASVAKLTQKQQQHHAHLCNVLWMRKLIAERVKTSDDEEEDDEG